MKTLSSQQQALQSANYLVSLSCDHATGFKDNCKESAVAVWIAIVVIILQQLQQEVRYFRRSYARLILDACQGKRNRLLQGFAAEQAQCRQIYKQLH